MLAAVVAGCARALADTGYCWYGFASVRAVHGVKHHRRGLLAQVVLSVDAGDMSVARLAQTRPVKVGGRSTAPAQHPALRTRSHRHCTAGHSWGQWRDVPGALDYELAKLGLSRSIEIAEAIDHPKRDGPFI